MCLADIEVPNHPVDMSSWGGSACYPRSTFYPLSDGPSIRIRRITMPPFPACSGCLPPSQAPLCHCTLKGRLPIGPRAPLEASVTLLEATTPVKLPTKQCPPQRGVRPQTSKGWYFNNDATSVAVSHKLDDGSLTFYECNSSLLSPKFIIYNPELCQYDNLNLEYSFIRILTLLFSIYFSVNKSTVLADRVIESTIKTVLLMYNKLKEKNNDLEYISNLMWASLSVHVSPMYNLSLDNCVNILTRAIVSAFDCTNEQASSLVIPAWFEFVLKKKTSRIAQLGSAVFNIPYNFSDVDSTAVQTVAKIKSLFENIGLPVKLGDLNGTGADIERILFKAGLPEKDSIGNNDKFSKTDCEVILSLTL